MRSLLPPPSLLAARTEQVSHVLKHGQTTPGGVELPVAEPGTEGQYFYSDKVHPSGAQGGA